MDKDSIIAKLAVEIERKTVGSAESWDEQQLRMWCFCDSFGIKSYQRSYEVAKHLAHKFDIKERE